MTGSLLALGWAAAGGAVALIALALVAGCGESWRDDDTTANTVAARAEARQLDVCGDDDAGRCTPAYVRASSSLAYCANARELIAHGKPAPEAGVSCRP